jgi:predicted O-methyltransferase YrrM
LHPVERARQLPEHKSMWANELEWLFETASKMESIVEIGSFLGRSTFVLCSACPGRVYAVDLFNDPEAGEDHMKAFMANVGHFPNLIPIQGTSLEASFRTDIPDLVDMVVVDADHEEAAVKLDLELWSARARRLICGHDYGDPRLFGVRKAVNDFFGEHNIIVGPRTMWAYWR